MKKLGKVLAALFPPLALVVIGGFLLGLEQTKTGLGWTALVLGGVGFFSSLWAVLSRN